MLLATLGCLSGGSIWLGGCASAAAPAASATTDTATTPEALPIPIRLHRLGPADVLLLGEQHDAPEHQQLHLASVNALVELNELAALVLEMADAGTSTAGLATSAPAETVQKALAWREGAWPWGPYAPAIMAAIAAGVPVLGGNLPRARNAQTMKEPAWDSRVPPDAWQRHQDAVRDGHCNLLPASQIAPMTRIQIARDVSLSQTAAAHVARGKTVVVLCGSQHAHRQLGIPLHMPPGLRVKAVRMAAGGARPDDGTAFDAVWHTTPVPPVDHCARLKERLGK
ncbi:MAG TPA: ChaN family lipoprotein [Burkholderiaceae bacterium]|nr:ChaN family lipoprotein [Burkholderiaceae bacterium]